MDVGPRQKRMTHALAAPLFSSSSLLSVLGYYRPSSLSADCAVPSGTCVVLTVLLQNAEPTNPFSTTPALPTTPAPRRRGTECVGLRVTGRRSSTRPKGED